MKYVWVAIAIAIILGVTFGCSSREDQYWKQVSKELGPIVNR